MTSADTGLCLHCGNERSLLFGEDVPATDYSDYMMECAALGALMMQDRDATELGMSRLQEHWFYAPLNRDVFRAIRTLWQARHIDGHMVVIEPLAVAAQLHLMNRYDSEYGHAYIVARVSATPCAANIGYYIDRVFEAWQQRMMQALSGFMARSTLRAGQKMNAARLCLDAIQEGAPVDFEAIFEERK